MRCFASGREKPLTHEDLAHKVKFCPCWRSSGAEQLPCKQWVGGSIPPASASFFSRFSGSSQRMPRASGRYPSGQRGQTVNLLANAFGGSNPPLATILPSASGQATAAAGSPGASGSPRGAAGRRGTPRSGNSSAVERQPSKLGVAGSNPVSRSTATGRPGAAPLRGANVIGAHVAQSVEHVLGKDGVTGSIPVVGSTLFLFR